MKRRSFILLSGLGLGAIALPLWYFKFRNLEYDAELSHPEMLSRIMDNESLGKMGAGYRKQFPKEKSERKLVSLLSSSVSEHIPVSESLQNQITDDYRSGKTLMLDGWILSKTEARQCALLSINKKYD